jgi:GNAT superfamily N-acetyltransferase
MEVFLLGINNCLKFMADTDLSYRRGSMEDLNKLKELGLKAYGEYRDVLTAENWEKLYNGLQNEEELVLLIKRATVFVCETIDQRMAGMAYLVPNGYPTDIYLKEWCTIRRLGVDPEFRGKGISRRLMQQCIDHARETNEKVIALHTSEFMDTARQLYERMGFVQVRRINDLFGKKYWLYTYDL